MALTPAQVAMIQQMAKNMPARPAPSPMADPQALMALRQRLAPPAPAPKPSGIDPASLMALKAKMQANTPQVQPSKSSIPGGQISRWSAGGVVQRMDDGGSVLTPQQMAQIASLGQPQGSSIPLPNGGMTGEALQNYIAANPGPQAMVGNNPANPGQTPTETEEPPIENEAEKEALAEEQEAPEEDEDKEEEVPSKKAVVKTENIPASSDEDEEDETSAPKGDYLSGLLAKLAVDPDRLKAAQQQQSDMMRNNALAMGGKEVAAALSRGGYKPNFEPNQQLNAMAQLPVQQQMQQQKIIQDAIQSGAQLTDLEDKAKLQDPTSVVSNAYRQTAVSMLPSIANSPGFQNMSAEGIKQMLPMADISVRSAANQEIAKQRMLQQQMMLEQRQDSQQDRQQQQSSNKELQNYNDLTKQLDSSRIQPDVRQALTDHYNNQKFQDLVNQAPGGDLNNLSQGQVELLKNELVKVSGGQAPTMPELAALDPNTLKSRFASTVGKIINEPTSANAGAFLKQYQDYMTSLDKTAQKTIHDRIGRMIESHQKDLSPEHVQTLNAIYNPLSKEANAGSTPTSNAPDHNAAAQWAAQNINSPDPATRQKAQQIAQLSAQAGGR